VRRIATAVFTFLTALAPRGNAQEIQPPRFANAVQTLSVGNTIKFVSNGMTVVGRYGGLDGDVLLLNASNATQRYPLSAVHVLWVQRRHVVRGAVIGGITGGILGAAFGLAASQIACETQACADDKATPMLVFGGLGALGVGGLGALIGAAAKHWTQVYP
jgi:hypothetical protein